MMYELLMRVSSAGAVVPVTEEHVATILEKDDMFIILILVLSFFGTFVVWLAKNHLNKVDSLIALQHNVIADRTAKAEEVALLLVNVADSMRNTAEIVKALSDEIRSVKDEVNNVKVQVTAIQHITTTTSTAIAEVNGKLGTMQRDILLRSTQSNVTASR